MAAIVRVKRRLDEDPAENLIVQYKRSRTDGDKANESAELCLSLATTVKSKDAALSRPLQKTLRRQQLQTSYKSRDTRHIRQAHAESSAKSKANRYRIVNSRRALSTNTSDLSETGAEYSVETTEKGTESAAQGASGLDRVPGCSHTDTGVWTSCGSNSESVAASSDTDNPIIHDVEIDSAVDGNIGEGMAEAAPSSGYGITLNGQVLVSQPASSATESNYVYDLYYVNTASQHYNFRDIENILSIEAIHDTLAAEVDRFEECDDVYDDEDDSNDESNWRNDYPDHDPDETNDYSDVELDEDFLEGDAYRSVVNDDLLAEEMGTRLHLFNSDASSGSDADDCDDENAYEDDEGDAQRHHNRGSSYEAYMCRIARELNDDFSDPENCDY